MGTILTVTSLKGGVGKTTFSAGIAYALKKYGKRVLAIDMDFGAGGLDIALGNEDTVVSSFLDIVNGKCELSDALVKDNNGIYFLSAPVFYTESECSSVSQENFDSLLKILRDSFDFVIFDMPAGGGEMFSFFENCPYCNMAIIVSTSSATSVRAAEKCAIKIKGFDEVKLLINCFRTSSPKDNSFGILEMISRISVPIIGVVPYDENAEKALLQGIPLSKKKSSDAGIAMCNVAKRLRGKNVFLLDGIMKRKSRNKYY